MIKKLKCLLGYHKWKYDKDTIVKANRECTECGEVEHSMHDMSYGETFWVKGKGW